jgi:hypothetical protein
MSQVSGNAAGLQQELSGRMEIVGRLDPKIACDYISQTKKAGTKVTSSSKTYDAHEHKCIARNVPKLIPP